MIARTEYDPQSLRARLRFARVFLKNPIMLGAVIPSSRRLTRHLLDELDWRAARVVVESGPGVGTLTTEILQRMQPGSTLVAIEYNPDLAAHLRESVTDPRLKVVHGSAVDVRTILDSLGLQQADYIISGIPYSTLPKEARERILLEANLALRPNGVMLVYQFTTTVLPHLRSVFKNVRQDFELLNILPARIFYCVRNEASGD
ncbi:MAG TPA: rRNA adenine N-6-methyltransferase family protein [Terriglobales bacterium]|nr:rRNA adenine N-6-methyltransferase family protein [Terriglobales bacterium]